MNGATRLKRSGSRIAVDGDREFIVWNDTGVEKRLEIPAWFKVSNTRYQAGQVEHLQLAMQLGMRGSSPAIAYIQWLARRQLNAGVAALDFSVDNDSNSEDEQRRMITWAVPVLQQVSGTVPLSLFSSHASVMRAGLTACDFSISRPILNAVMGVGEVNLDLAEEWNVPFIWFATGAGCMPHSVEERIGNLRQMVQLAIARGIDLSRIYFDLLIYPKLANAREGLDALQAFAAARREFGPRLKLIGGLSNFSYGLPLSSYVLLVLLDLAIAHGCSGAVLNPFTVHPKRLAKLDRDADCYKRTAEMILSEDDEQVMNFLGDACDGVIEDPFAKK